MKKEPNEKLQVKLGNVKSTAGLAKFATISGYIEPKRKQNDYDVEIYQLKETLIEGLKTNINQCVFNHNRVLGELSIKNNRLSTKKPSFFYFEFYVKLINESDLEDRDKIRRELTNISNTLIKKVFYKQKNFKFTKTLSDTTSEK